MLVKMQDEWREKGLIVAGVHVKPSVKDQALDLCRVHKINFPNYNTGHVEFKGVDGTPTVFIFDSAGALAHKGAFAGREKMLEELLKAAPDWVTGSRNYGKASAEAEQIRARRNLGGAAAALRVKANSEDPAEKEEAEELLARLARYAEGRMKRAAARLEAGAPDEAMALWKQCAVDFKGDALGDGAAALAKEKEADPAFQREIEALKVFVAMQKTSEGLKPRRREQAEDAWRAKNAAVLAQLQSMLHLLQKRHAGTFVLKRAEDLLKSLGL